MFKASPILDVPNASVMVAAVSLKKDEPWEGFPPRRGFGPSTFASLDSALPRQRSSQAELPRHDVHPRLTSIYHLCPVSLWTRPSSRLYWRGMETQFRVLRGFSLTIKCKCNRKVRTKGFRPVMSGCAVGRPEGER